jgi:hypothetical protein
VYGMSPPDWLGILIRPHGWIGNVIPWYVEWVDWGLALFGII